jgi:hypothetical protein
LRSTSGNVCLFMNVNDICVGRLLVCLSHAVIDVP